MTETSSIIPTDASAIAVDTSCIDVSEVKKQEDKDFLMEKGEIILRIVARAALDVGRELAEIQDHFREHNLKGLEKYYESIEVTKAQAVRWANKYRAYCTYVEIRGELGAAERFNEMGDVAGSRLWNLPAKFRKSFILELEEGENITEPKVREFASKPEVQLEKLNEQLEVAKTKASGNGSRQQLHFAKTSISNFEQQIAALEAQIEEERLNTKRQEEATAKVETELQKLKFDDAQYKAERVKKLATTLTVSLPQALADVSKFFAEIDLYPEETRDHIYNQARALANEIADHL